MLAVRKPEDIVLTDKNEALSAATTADAILKIGYSVSRTAADREPGRTVSVRRGTQPYSFQRYSSS